VVTLPEAPPVPVESGCAQGTRFCLRD
jgi:hypothetical protein